MKILVGTVGYITCKEHLYFLNKTLSSVFKNVSEHHIDVGVYWNKTHDVIVGNFPHEVLHWSGEREEQSLAGCWNRIINEGKNGGYDYTIVINSDIIMNTHCIANLVKFAEERKDMILWTASEHANEFNIDEDITDNGFDEFPHFSCFMVNKETIDKVGWFDEKVGPAYFEDFLYHYKMLRLGFKAGKTGMAKFFHYGSRTIKCDDNLNRRNFVTYEKNRKYVGEVVGVDPHSMPANKALEKGFKYPFNDPKKSWLNYQDKKGE